MIKLSTLPEAYLKVIEIIFSEFDGALIIDEKGIIRVYTEYYERETGMPRDQVIGKPVNEVFPDTKLLQVLETGKHIIGDIWQLNGKVQVVSRVPITAGGKIIGAAGFNIFRYIDDARGFARRFSQMVSELKYYKEEIKMLSSAKYSLASIVGQSEAILEAKERVRLIASSSIPVSIYGETGTGKELFAHAVHQESPRREKPLIRINCASLPENLIESEMFGYEEGAFTGARKKGKPGKFEIANQGSLFLDEIAELSNSTQARLLRVLQEKEIERVGGSETIPVDVRIISASNVPLNQLVSQAKFRKDLLFRLDVFPIYIPPLRERKEDILPLVEHFITQYNRENGTHIEGINNQALKMLHNYHWPGNARELNNLIERACIDARQGIITVDNLLRFVSKRNKTPEQTYTGFNINKSRDEAEKATILRALQASNGNKSQAAQLLGLSRSALYNKLQRFDIA